jgi:hypothetical protein
MPTNIEFILNLRVRGDKLIMLPWAPVRDLNNTRVLHSRAEAEKKAQMIRGSICQCPGTYSNILMSALESTNSLAASG